MTKFGKYFITGIISITIIYSGYKYWITEKYHLEIGNDYEIDLIIKPDETFLDGQDDYNFKFYKNGKSSVTLKVQDCLSRCWVINQSVNNPNIIFLYGCYKNKMMAAKFKIDFTLQAAIPIDEIPDNSVVLDTLTNLYVDKQLPPNYKYEY
ncbi:MAG: hypothetical protein R2788_05730 [Saprospiraceae bacterium]